MPRVTPINEMNPALLVSSGAAEMSTFHQLSGEKSGRGVGSGPLRITCGDAGVEELKSARTKSASGGAARRFLLDILIDA
jgi:hypothetical protein